MCFPVTRITLASCCRTQVCGVHHATHCLRTIGCGAVTDVRMRVKVGVSVQQRDSNDNWGSAKARGTIGGRRAAMRVVVDRLNGMVVVYEQDATALDAGPRTLVFESPTGVFRLEAFPGEWRRLSDDALLALRMPHA